MVAGGWIRKILMIRNCAEKKKTGVKWSWSSGIQVQAVVCLFFWDEIACWLWEISQHHSTRLLNCFKYVCGGFLASQQMCFGKF